MLSLDLELFLPISGHKWFLVITSYWLGFNPKALLKVIDQSFCSMIINRFPMSRNILISGTLRFNRDPTLAKLAFCPVVRDDAQCVRHLNDAAIAGFIIAGETASLA